MNKQLKNINNNELQTSMEDWVECELGEICTYSKGKKPKNLKGEKSKDVSIPYINIKAFEKGIYDQYTNGDKCNFCEDGDLLMVWDGARAGYTGKAKKGAVGSTLMKIEPVNGIEKDYLFYFLCSLYTKLNTNPRGVGIPHVEPRILWNSKFVICNSSLQKAIVKKIESLFSDLDNGIANLKKAGEQLKIYRQAVLKKAFEGELTKAWREQKIKNYKLGITNDKLPTAEELLAQIKEERKNNYELQITNWKKAVKQWEENGKEGKKPTKPKAIKELPPLTDEELKELPKISQNGFYIRMGNLSDVVRGGSPRPAGDERYYNGNIPFLKVADLTRSKTKYVNSFSFTIKEAGLHKTRLLEIGTLVISNSGATLGVPRILAIQATANDGIAAFLGLNKDMVNYLFFYWDSKTIALRNIDQGAGQPNLNTDLLKDFPVPIFSIPEQHQIVQEIESRLSVCDAMEQSIAESLEKANALRQSILKQAFEGKLLSQSEIEACKQEADYEPASVLLEKIKAEKENIASKNK